MNTQIMNPPPLSPEIIEQALREATDEQFASERGRRNAAARQTAAGGRPKTLKPCPYCFEKFGARDLTTHKPHCDRRPLDRKTMLLADKEAAKTAERKLQKEINRLDKGEKKAQQR